MRAFVDPRTRTSAGPQHARDLLGGLAIGALLGVPKRTLERKLFGVFAHEPLAGQDRLLPREGAAFSCAHSRHAGCDDAALERAAAAGRVRLLARAGDAGYAVFASADYRFVAHLGHPEYEVDRLVFEWKRDKKGGRTDVTRPHGVDLVRPETTWRADSDAFFAQWLQLSRGGCPVATAPSTSIGVDAETELWRDRVHIREAGQKFTRSDE